MELKLNFDEVFYPQTIYENYIEDKLEGDLILPDYLSSAQKIIHCEANPVVLNKSITAVITSIMVRENKTTS